LGEGCARVLLLVVESFAAKETGDEGNALVAGIVLEESEELSGTDEGFSISIKLELAIDR